MPYRQKTNIQLFSNRYCSVFLCPSCSFKSFEKKQNQNRICSVISTNQRLYSEIRQASGIFAHKRSFDIVSRSVFYFDIYFSNIFADNPQCSQDKTAY